MLECITVSLGLLCRVRLSFDGFPFSGFAVRVSDTLFVARIQNWHLHIQIINVVPNHLKTVLFLVDLDGKPDVSAFPKRIGVPLFPSVTMIR